MTARRILPPYHTAMQFAEYGMDRDLPAWVDCDYRRPILELGPGNVKMVDGAVPFEWPQWEAELDPLPYDDGTVGGVYATHFLEHLHDPRIIIREVARVLAPGCPFNIVVPHARADIHIQDLDHKTPFVLETFRHLVSHNQYYDKSGVGTALNLRLGASFVWAVKEQNLAVIAQLVKEVAE